MDRALKTRIEVQNLRTIFLSVDYPNLGTPDLLNKLEWSDGFEQIDDEWMIHKLGIGKDLESEMAFAKLLLYH